MIAIPTIYKCPNCQSLISGQDYRSGNTINGISYSDTYIKAPMKIPDSAGYIGCANCKNVYAKRNLEIIKQFEDHYDKNISREEQEKNQREELKEWASNHNTLPEFEMIKILLEDPKFGSEYQKPFALYYLWYFNHELKQEEKKGEVENGNYKKYTDKLISILDSEKDSENSKVLKAEVLRERGEFDEAEEALDFVDPSKFVTQKIKYVFEEMKKKIAQKDSEIFEADQKPEFIK